MLGVLKRHWFLVGLMTVIPVAIIWAQMGPSASAITAVQWVPTSVCTATILFLMSVTLNTGRLLDSVRKPAPCLTACGVNQIVIPLMCLPLLALQNSADMKVGLLIAASVPCTMAAASVWTRRANGNDAVSLLVTLITNGLCFVVAPLWMTIGVQWFGTSGTSSELNFITLMQKMILAALLPAAVGQLFRRSQAVADFVDRNKSIFSNLAQAIILFLVFVSSFKGGLQFLQDGMSDNLRHTEFAIVWGCCIALHLAGMLVAWWLSGLLKFDVADRRACAIAGSQKTLPIGILISQATGLPFSLLPMLMFHASQLFIDTWIADRMKAGDDEADGGD